MPEPKAYLALDPTKEIAIHDIDGVIEGAYFASFRPLGYTCKVVISPYALVKLLDWCIKTGIIESRPDIYSDTHCRKKRIG